MVIYDGQQNDTRMNLAIALTAGQNGATVVNHCAVESLVTDGTPGEAGYTVNGAYVTDDVTGKHIKVNAKVVINACGVFSDKIRTMVSSLAT